MGQSESSPSPGSTPSRKDKSGEGGRRTNSRGHAPSPNLSNTTSAPSSTEHTNTSRPRSITSASAPVTMGNEESKQVRPPSRSSTLQTPPPASEQQQPSPLAQAVDIPGPSNHDADLHGEEPIPITSPFGLPASAFTNPPRLPIPIERDPEPSSPILGPHDTASLPLGDDNDDVDLPKRASLVSSSTLDDEDGADLQQFAMETDPMAPKVQTTITWQEGGRHVYVTGTFASWEKKFRMHKNKDGVFRATIPLTPGTHHLVFLVDGDPKTSMEIPTTVDFANALVNYIEVLAPDVAAGEKQATQAMPIPGAAARKGVSSVDDQPMPTALGGASQGDSSAMRGSGIVAADHQPSTLRPHSLPRQPAPSDEAGTSASARSANQQQQSRESQPKSPIKQSIPRAKYTSEIPPILLHLDLYNTPNDARFRLASKACQVLPQPPSLPMFMSKSILNATTPQKDDASVLTMPNHTVLNHLATSSIRNGVLATSGTTRYKRKFLTTILYQPTSDSG